MADKLAMPDEETPLSEQQAKRISERLANKVRAGDTTSPEFKADLQKYDAFRRQQISQGKATRAGKNSALITPFLDALPQEQRALGLHISTEVAASAEDIKEHVTAEMQKWQCRPGAAAGCTIFHVDHAAIRTDLERRGFTATQLLSLHKAANLKPPMCVNAAGAEVPEKTKYLLAQSLCSAAGSGQHAIQSIGDAGASSSGARSERQLLDYATLGAWIEALRHQRPFAEWEPPVHAALLEPQPPKKRRACQQLAPVLDGSASGGGGANGPLTLEGEALEQINGGLHEGFLDPGLQRELLEYFEEQLRNDEPYAVTMAGPRPFVLKHKKLMYGTLSDGMVPIYNFGLIYEDLRKTKPMPQRLQLVADQVERTFQQLPNNCVVNIYPSGGDEISPHQDQRFSDGNGRFESEQPVFIIRLGATRPLVLHTLDGRETREFQLESGDLYRLTGFVNTHFQHSVPAVENCGLCITLSFRLVSNEMYPSGRFAIINGKKRALAKNEREPCVANRPSSASPVPKQLRAIEPSLSTGTSRERSQGRNEDGDADAPKTRQGRRVSPMPTSPPEDVRLERVLSVKCPKLGLAMLGGEKPVENRKYELPLGWHWLYISKARDLKGLEEFKSQIDKLQYSSEEQEKCYGHVIGSIYVVAIRQPKDCNGNPWAKGPYCHVISHSLTLTQPVLIQKPGAISVRWTIKSEQERQLIRAQIPQGPPKAIDFQKALGERA